MAVASILSRAHEVAIDASNLPGDNESLNWACMWSGAVFYGLDGSTLSEQEMQRDALLISDLWQLRT